MGAVNFKSYTPIFVRCIDFKARKLAERFSQIAGRNDHYSQRNDPEVRSYPYFTAEVPKSRRYPVVLYRFLQLKYAKYDLYLLVC